MSTQYLNLNGSKIAYKLRAPKASHEDMPYVVYFGGLMSSMEGTKASVLDEWSKSEGFGFVRFDYRGHGESDGEFTDFGPDDWIEDAALVLENLIPNKAIVLGSSLGGWVGAGVAKLLPQKFERFIGIAAAPDFTQRDFVHRLSDSDMKTLQADGIVELASDYPEPYRISRALIDGGRRASVLSSELKMDFPVRLLHGLSDHVVEPSIALDFAEHIMGGDVQVRLVKGEDHGFSSANAISIIQQTILSNL